MTILERTGDSRWYIKHTNVGEVPDIASVFVKLTADLSEDVCENDDEDMAAVLR